jgi:hypothetical protein
VCTAHSLHLPTSPAVTIVAACGDFPFTHISSISRAHFAPTLLARCSHQYSELGLFSCSFSPASTVSGSEPHDPLCATCHTRAVSFKRMSSPSTRDATVVLTLFWHVLDLLTHACTRTGIHSLALRRYALVADQRSDAPFERWDGRGCIPASSRRAADTVTHCTAAKVRGDFGRSLPSGVCVWVCVRVCVCVCVCVWVCVWVCVCVCVWLSARSCTQGRHTSAHHASIPPNCNRRLLQSQRDEALSMAIDDTTHATRDEVSLVRFGFCTALADVW